MKKYYYVLIALVLLMTGLVIAQVKSNALGKIEMIKRFEATAGQRVIIIIAPKTASVTVSPSTARTDYTVPTGKVFRGSVYLIGEEGK